MKSRSKKVLRTGIFVIIILVIFIFINSLFQPIWYRWGSINTATGFYDEPENSLEVVLVGPSVMASGIIPTEMYDEYGICAYNLASMKQPMMGSYYWIEETYRLHPETLKTVVLEMSGIRAATDDPFYHKCFDYMKLSDVKFRAVKEYANGDTQKMIEFLLPIAAYHDRWNDLNNDDLTYYVDDQLNDGNRGWYLYDYFYESADVAKLDVRDTTLNGEDAEPTVDPVIEESIEQFHRIVAFCEEHDIDLVLTKFPTFRWDTYLHNEAQALADQYNLPFLDYNFSPTYETVDFIYPFDTLDGKHLNYYGADKYTKVLSEYLVENCDLTDVRSIEKYGYMKDVSEEYNGRIRQRIALRDTESITEYLEVGTNEDTTLFITAKGSASDALTDEQREYFREAGLDKLANLGSHQAYIAVIDRGEVLFEKTSVEGDTEAIRESGNLSNDVYYEMVSGGFENGNTAYCKVGRENYSRDSRGLNVVAYNHVVDEVIYTTVFDTCASSTRDVYSVDAYDEVKSLPADAEVNPHSITGQIIKYMKMEDDFKKAEKLRETIGEDNVVGFLDAYMNDSDNLIIMAGGIDISKTLSAGDRAALSQRGLSEVADVGYGDAYVAMIESGHVTEEIRKGPDEAICIEERGMYIKSAGTHTGRTSAIEIDGQDYVEDVGGLNIVVYNQAENRVIDYINF